MYARHTAMFKSALCGRTDAYDLQALEPRLYMSATVDGAENITSMGISSQSTTLQNFPAWLAIDGDPNTVSHTVPDDANAKWKLAFDSNHSLSKIIIHNQPESGATGAGFNSQEVQRVTSHNTVSYYPHQSPSLYRRDAVKFNGVNSYINVASNAANHIVGRSGLFATDRYRIHARWNIDPSHDTPQILFNVGDTTRGYAAGWHDNQLYFVIKDADDVYAYGGQYIPDGDFVDIFFDWLSGGQGSIAVNGNELDIDEAEIGLGSDTTLTELVNGAFTIGGSTGNSIFSAVSMIPEIAELIGTEWIDNNGFSKGELAYFWLQRSEDSEEVKDYDLPLDEAAGRPVDATTDSPVESINNIEWVSVAFDEFLYRWDIDTLDYDLAYQPVAPETRNGHGELGLASWSDLGFQGEDGLPVMEVGPYGVISAKTGTDIPSRHSEIFGPSPLFNVEKYYMSWSLYIDSGSFLVPGELTGDVMRILRMNYGDSARGFQGAFGFRNIESDSQPITRLYGFGFRETHLEPNFLPFDKWFRIVVEYTPSDRNRDGGIFRASVDGGKTWPFVADHWRTDNYFWRIGTRVNTDETAVIHVTDLAYGSDLESVYAANNPLAGDFTGNRSALRDIRITIRDAADTHDVYVSPILNPNNSEFIHPGGPDKIEIDLIGLTGGVVNGGIINIERIADLDLSGTSGQGTVGDSNVLSIGEVEVYAIPIEEVDLPLRISEILYFPQSPNQSEFIELLNIGDEVLDLTGIQFKSGDFITGTLHYEFLDTDANRMLQPGGRIVIPADKMQFINTHAEVSETLISDRSFTGSLPNSGIQLYLSTGEGGIIHAFEYENGVEWDYRARGGGPSIEIINPLGAKTDWNFAEYWRVSGIDHGTPGRADPVDGAIAGDLNYDGEVNLVDLADMAANFGNDANLNTLLDVRWQDGDLNGDGAVNLVDLALLATHFGLSGSNGFPINPPDGQAASEALNFIDQSAGNSPVDSFEWGHIHNLLNSEDETYEIL